MDGRGNILRTSLTNIKWLDPRSNGQNKSWGLKKIAFISSHAKPSSEQFAYLFPAAKLVNHSTPVKEALQNKDERNEVVGLPLSLIHI